ncbi:dual specificity protein phosphatase [uncultured Sphaerochaeta sp.]|uniref:dual specificity protein phosphatase family protein n=1 Tax=uncultured Sphaerochaeta sp. TaxID=886478 RepID=UPI002A0A90DF|nr:dual specificity protein phosphatase [uncultured Sphaerochaeta sp.]
MKEIFPNLFIGNQEDFDRFVKFQQNWATIHACKEPYHRKAVGYTGRSCSKDNAEYLLAIRDDELMLNLVDVADPLWISPIIIDKAISFISEKLDEGKKVLVHCNQGHSRSAIIGLLFLASKGYFSKLSFKEAEIKYLKIYPDYFPAGGVKGYARQEWSKYRIDLE